MATIKDIARLAGVSQGTVSHVLNGKSNVSSEKIAKVQKAAQELGYVVNESARNLRKGETKSLAVVIPNLSDSPFMSFYNSFKTCAENRGYQVFLYHTGDDAQREREIIQKSKAEMVQGVAVYSCFLEGENPYAQAGFPQESVLFVERRPQFACRSIGFDNQKMGQELARRLVADGHQRVALLTGMAGFPNEEALAQAFVQVMEQAGGSVRRIKTDVRQSAQAIVSMFTKNQPPQAVVLTRYGMARTVKDVWESFFSHLPFSIYTLSPIFTLPEQDFVKYELNYAKMGYQAAMALIENKKTDPGHVVLDNYGFRQWGVPRLAAGGEKEISLLLLESPESFAVECVTRRYTQETGIAVRTQVVDYNTMFTMLSSENGLPEYDVLRLDVTLLSWFAGRVLQPLTAIQPNVEEQLSVYLKGVVPRYSLVDGQLYALPTSPSIQLLFYRKDLFEDTALRRLYHEQYGDELQVPQNFAQFNQVAEFFNRERNPHSPVAHGCTLTLGNSGVIGSEFLVRFFSYSKNLYDEKGKVDFQGPAGQQALADLCGLLDSGAACQCDWWTQAAAQFAAGQTAMAILYSNFASDILAPGSVVTSSLGISPVPGANPLIGGGTLGVCKGSRKAENALHFIRWLCSEPASSAVALLGGASACTETYENFEVVEAYPWLSLAKEGFSPLQGLRQPPENAQPFNERKLLNLIAQGVRQVQKGQLTQAGALAAMQKEYDENFTSR